MKSAILIVLVAAIFFGVTFALNRERDCKCRAPINPRIIGGRRVGIKSYPWQISISKKYPYKHNCGGSIINERYVLTAAHCIKPKMAQLYQIGFSSNDLEKMKFVEIEKAIIHSYADIALIKLKQPLWFSKTVQPACLGLEYQEKYEGPMTPISDRLLQKVTTGYGVYDNSLQMSRYLKEATVYDRSATLPLCMEQNICVENRKTKETACYGDSGGPLHYVKNGKSTVVGITSGPLHYVKNGKSAVVGITSFGDEKDPNQPGPPCIGPGAYVRLPSFKKFIEDNVGDDYCV